eukprot:TRINITY_DN5175_c0_g1_i6.p1 TRINITY_DN5175_c0_g1~~TRINITY_DN5175_c0_g1_i6.p1  ORF type:complete len:238 (+),score=9.11 TRINITY_DN5175_c0_g1_i6:429-1142(+)
MLRKVSLERLSMVMWLCCSDCLLCRVSMSPPTPMELWRELPSGAMWRWWIVCWLCLGVVSNNTVIRAVEDGLGRAARRGHVAVVDRLSSVPGVDGKIRKNAYNFTLTQAAEQGHVDGVKQLLATPGIDATAYDNAAITGAAKSGHVAVVNLLLSVPGVDVQKAMREAIKAGRWNVIEVLLGHPNAMPVVDTDAGALHCPIARHFKAIALCEQRQSYLLSPLCEGAVSHIFDLTTIGR